jgi:mRNA-degrading endonuclease toxin of MazEF toxin-antitoxin module
MDEKLFHDWCIVKQSLHQTKNAPFFQNREIWFCHIGCNVGYEQDGKGREWLRPVLVVKKFNTHTFLGIPMTSKVKKGRHYFYFPFDDREVTAILSQIRLIDSKRLKRKIGEVDKATFRQICRKCHVLFFRQEETRGN